MNAEAPVTTETVNATETPAEAVPFREQVRAELNGQSKDQAPETPEVKEGDDTPAEQTAEEPKTEDQPVEAVESEDTLLTAEEVSKLSGKELDLYKKAQKNYTQKTQRLAEREKELEPFSELISALKDPVRAKETIAQLAQQAGITPRETAPVAKPVELDPEYEFMRPMFQSFKDEAKREALAELKAEIAPLKSQTDEIMSKSMAEATTATLTAFGKTHEGWEKHEAQMIALGKQIQPTGAMTELEYLDVLYKVATHGHQSAEQTKKVVDKMKKAAEAAEPPVQGVQSERVEYARPANIAGMSSRDRFLAAHEAGKRNQKWV